jgi:single-stranded DNA-specific DHH superfamily exonuclease
MRSIEPSKDIERDIERIMDEKLHEMFYITRKMLAEVESKNDLLDIFRENMEDIVDKHYDLYKKFKYVKEDMEDMVYDKGSQSSRNRR